MIISYTFNDPQSGITFTNPEGLNDIISQDGDKLFRLQANNGKGKSWLLTFIISSLIEFPERMKGTKSPLLVMTAELLEKVQQLRAHSSGHLQGKLEITLGDIKVEIEYKFGEPHPKRRFAPVNGPESWSDLDDSILMQHARFCYLIPENPTKRIEGIKTNIKIQLANISNTQETISMSLSREYRENTTNIRNEALIEELKNELRKATRDKEDKQKKLESLKTENQHFVTFTALKDLRMALTEYERIKTEVTKVKSEISKMPKVRSSQEEQDIYQKWAKAQTAIDSSPLANIVRFISHLGDEEFNDFGDFQSQYLAELDAVKQLVRLSDLFEDKAYDSNPFLNSDKQSLAKYRKILLQPSLESDIVAFFTKITAISTEEQEGLAAIKELIEWLEKRADIAEHLLRDKLRLDVSCQGLLTRLQDEERKMVAQEKLNLLAQEIEDKISRIPQALDEFNQLKKDFLKAQKNFEDVSRDTSAAGRQKLLRKKDEQRDWQIKEAKAEKDISTQRTIISNKAPLLKLSSISDVNASIKEYTRQNPKASKGVQIELQAADSKYRQQAAKVRELQERLSFESSKSKSSFTPEDLEKIKPYVNLRSQFAQFCDKANGLFSETTPTHVGNKIRDLFGDVAKKQLGGEILFDGVKRKLDSVDFSNEALVYLDSDLTPRTLQWNRLSTGNSAALFLNSTLYNVIQENKTVVALIDEVGDMTSDSRQQAFQSVRQNSSQFALFMTAEPKEGGDFEITPLK